MKDGVSERHPSVEVDRPETYTIEYVKENLDSDKIREGNFYVQDEIFIVIDEEFDEELSTYWSLINELTPVDWKGYPGESEFLQDPTRGEEFRNTGYSAGVDVNKIIDIIRKSDESKVHIKNIIMICDVLRDKEGIEKSSRERFAAYAKYFFIPLLKTFELPEISLELENLVFETLDSETYTTARNHWKANHGVDYDSEYKKPLVKTIRDKVVVNTEFDENDIKISVRKKSLYEYYTKFYWQGVVDDGYAATVVVNKGQKYKNIFSKYDDSTLLNGEILVNEIIMKGFLDDDDMESWRHEAIDNWIDEEHPFNPSYKVLQTIIGIKKGVLNAKKFNKPSDFDTRPFRIGKKEEIEYIRGILPYDRFELRVAFNDGNEENITAHPLYKIWEQSPTRVGVRESDILLLGRLNRALLRRDFSGSKNTHLIKGLLLELEKGKEMPLCVNWGHATVYLSDYRLYSVLGNLEMVSEQVGRYTVDIIEGFEVDRTIINPNDGSVERKRYKIRPGSPGFVVYEIQGEDEVLINSNAFFLKPYDIITAQSARIVNDNELIYSTFVTTASLIKGLSFKGSEYITDLIATNELGLRLPNAMHSQGSLGKDLRMKMIESWKASLKSHYILMKNISPASRKQQRTLFEGVKREIESVFTIIDLLRYISNRGGGEGLDREIKKLRKEIEKLSGKEEIAYIRQVIESESKYIEVVNSLIDFRHYFTISEKDYVMEAGKRRAWVKMASEFKIRSPFLYERIKANMHNCLLVERPELWETIVSICNNQGIDAYELFAVRNKKEVKRRILGNKRSMKIEIRKDIDLSETFAYYKNLDDPTAFYRGIKRWLGYHGNQIKTGNFDREKFIEQIDIVKDEGEKLKEMAIYLSSERHRHYLIFVLKEYPQLLGTLMEASGSFMDDKALRDYWIKIGMVRKSFGKLINSVLSYSRLLIILNRELAQHNEIKLIVKRLHSLLSERSYEDREYADVTWSNALYKMDNIGLDGYKGYESIGDWLEKMVKSY